MTYIENRYCMDCVCIHWLEVDEQNNETCHGRMLSLNNPPPNTYFKRSGKGFEMHETTPRPKPVIELPLDWQMREEAGL